MSENWAICIGINEYYNLQDLQYAEQDAAAVRDFCLGEGQFKQVYYFATHADPIKTPRGFMRSEPTFANLKRFFRERFQRKFLDVGDNFWFFFAGHGELHNGHDYLMPLDVDPGNLEETALRVSDITAYLRNSGADNTVLLLDACRSENQGRRLGLGLGTEEQKGMVTVYSCSPAESSWEIEALGHGAFTHALLEGLALQGATNCATVERLDQYLRYQVPKLNASHGKPVQTPYTAVEPLSKNHWILLPGKATLVDVLTLKNDAQEAENEDELERAERLWIRVLAASPADRQAVVALKRITLKQARQSATPGPAAAPTAGSRSVEAPVSPPPQVPPAVPPQQQVERVTPPAPPQSAPPTFPFEVVTVNEHGQIIQRQERSAEYRREDLGNGVSLDLVRIPEGEFMMGQTDSEKAELIRQVGEDNYQKYFARELPRHQVSVPQFWMGKYPVTQAQYQAVMGKNPSRFTKNGANRPVETVSWDDAVAFCQKLSKQTGRDYRLPSEAEWEYACRAGTTTPFHFGPTLTPEIANYDGNYTYGYGPKGAYRKQTTEVGSFKVANAFGLYDMHGNVWEWCADRWHENYDGSPTDGRAWLSDDENAGRLLRGGSWDYFPWYCRSALRDGLARVGTYYFIGFRIVCASPWALS